MFALLLHCSIIVWQLYRDCCIVGSAAIGCICVIARKQLPLFVSGDNIFSNPLYNSLHAFVGSSILSLLPSPLSISPI